MGWGACARAMDLEKTHGETGGVSIARAQVQGQRPGVPASYCLVTVLCPSLPCLYIEEDFDSDSLLAWSVN